MKKLIVLSLIALSLHANPVDDLKRDVLQILPTFQGWCSHEKALNFIDLVLEVRPDVCVEIGVFGGRSLFPVAKALRFLDKGVIIGIDSWDNDDCIRDLDPIKDQIHINWWSKLDLGKVYNSYVNWLIYHELDDFCITLRSTSEKAAYSFVDIDILYLDGQFSKVGSKRDVELYLPKVRMGGYIWLNDALSPNRKEALELLSASCTVVKEIENGSCVLFRKR